MADDRLWSRFQTPRWCGFAEAPYAGDGQGLPHPVEHSSVVERQPKGCWRGFDSRYSNHCSTSEPGWAPAAIAGQTSVASAMNGNGPTALRTT